ncbi:MAG: GDP-mannose 4,6-dehydratase [Microbacteriaceae bacterium]|nr:GDP-mannose 4,6-dehydratase [Microbacteriaceae bacterium]
MPVAFVTGVTGQTGSYLAENLIGRGWTVHGLVRSGEVISTQLDAELQLHEGDLTDTGHLGRLVRQISPDSVINLAAMSSVALSWEQPVATAAVNGLAVASLIDAAYSVHKTLGKPVSFVQASSAEIFGNAEEAPQTESTPLRPINPYGASKAYAHLLVGAYRNLGLLASSVILYNHESPRRPVQFVTRKITAGVARIKAGLQNDLVLGDLNVRRDWGWAPDYADALARIAVGDKPNDYIVATGESHTIEDFVASAFVAAGISDWRGYVKTDQEFIRPADASELRGDATRIQNTYGWKPTIRFDEIVRRMVEADLAELQR